jgi:hypothetical protein
MKVEELAGHAFTMVYFVSLFGPVLLLAFLWRRLSSQESDVTAVATAALVSISYGYLLGALLFRSALLGGDYSERLFATVETNTALSLCLFILAVVRKSTCRPLLAGSALVVSVAWFLIWAVNAAV